MTPEDIANWLGYLSGPPILKDEVRYALKKLWRKPGKAASPDEVDTEMLQALDEAGIDLLHSLISRIYEWNDPIWAIEIHLCHTPQEAASPAASPRLFRLQNYQPDKPRLKTSLDDLSRKNLPENQAGDTRYPIWLCIRPGHNECYLLKTMNGKQGLKINTKKTKCLAVSKITPEP